MMLSSLHFTDMLIASFGKYGTAKGDPISCLRIRIHGYGF
jgi:hypothetical protein